MTTRKIKKCKKKRANSKENEGKFADGTAVILKGELKGTIRYFGRVKGSNGKNKKGDFYGVELTEPNGKNNGSVNGISYFMTKPNYGIFVRLDRIKHVVDPAIYKINIYPLTTTQFFDTLLPVFILYLDCNTLCNLLKVETFCKTFRLKKFITFKHVMSGFVNGSSQRRQKLQNLYSKEIRTTYYGNCSSINFAVWNILNYKDIEKKYNSKSLKRIICVSLLMAVYDNGSDMLGANVDVSVDEQHVKFFTEYAEKQNNSTKQKKNNMNNRINNKSTKQNKSNIFKSFKYSGRLLKKWDEFDGNLSTEKSLKNVFSSGKMFGKNGKILFNRTNKLLLGPMIKHMVKEWIVLDGGISEDNMYDSHSERFSFVFGWIEPQNIVMVGAPYSVTSFDYDSY